MRTRGGYRLASGGVIDRSRPLTFRFDGASLQGYVGDTLASALLANGVTVVARSLKYHRPRGLYAAGVEDPSSMLAVRDAYGYDPAIRAGQVALAQDLDARTVSGVPSVRFDVGALAQLAGSALAAGFYYKAFMWPSWRLFEPLIRRATGFGYPVEHEDRRVVQHRHLSCDVLIVGGGCAGLAAARSLQGTGLSVVLAEEHPTLGGSLLWEDWTIDGEDAVAFAHAASQALRADSNVKLWTSTLVTGAYENNFFTLVQQVRDDHGVRGERLAKLQAKHVVLATGCIDRPLPFPYNDRPGIMLSSAVRRFIGEYAVAPARRLAVYTNNDAGFLTALQAYRAGIEVAGVIDTRPRDAAVHVEEAKRLNIPCWSDAQIVGTSGYMRLAGVRFRSRDGQVRSLACDGLAVTGGSTPLIHLAAHRGIKPRYDEARSAFLYREVPSRWYLSGGAAGICEPNEILEHAQDVAHRIARAEGVSAAAAAFRVEAPQVGRVTPQWLSDTNSASCTWIDLQNDVKLSDIKLARQEGYVSAEHLKRYTTLGMGTDQGRTSNVVGLGALTALAGGEMTSAITTTFRPPYAAVRMATLAGSRRGENYRATRLLPADAEHRRHGAVMEDFGWERPDWYRCNGDLRETAVLAEMRAVRERAGIFDSSSLGKIEIVGPDAATFISRFYVSDLSSLQPSRVRYSVMLREDGVVFDDGVVTRVGPAHFIASPTSGNAEVVATWFERWRQTEWPHLRVAILPVTSEWAAIAIAGPSARDILQRLSPSFDMSNAGFPHMSFREGEVAGMRARVARVSFTGELQYEVSVKARHAPVLLATLLAEHTPVGLEAWLRLRIEKGYLHVGSEINGRVNPLDIGMAGAIARREEDFIGKRSLALPHSASADREQFVGLELLEGALETGARILAPGHHRIPAPTQGYVTSCCFSPTLGKSVGLGLLEGGRRRIGEQVTLYSSGAFAKCRISQPSFFDPAGDRLRL